jgi:predicted acylesterase/phospholipase RssA
VTRALVLNAGASWCAYQVGALRHLVNERQLHFDVCAGTAMGAMNAAFVACGQLPALEELWSNLRPADILPSRRRRFMAAHVSETALAERGTVLLVTALHLQTGRLDVLRYPGCPVPLVDGLLASAALPGAARPVRCESGQLVEGAIIDAVPMGPVLEEQPSEVVAVLSMLPEGGGARLPYGTWRSVLRRALEVNQADDARRALAAAASVAAEAEAHSRARREVLQAAAGVPDTGLVERLGRGFDQHQPPAGPEVLAIRPSRPLWYPMWRFRRSDLAAAAALGERDARSAS